MIERVMMRCATCTRWWSIGPSDDPHCACGGELAAVDMKAHIAALPDGNRPQHNHQTRERKPPEVCPACDHDLAAEQAAAKEAKKAKAAEAK